MMTAHHMSTVPYLTATNYVKRKKYILRNLSAKEDLLKTVIMIFRAKRGYKSQAIYRDVLSHDSQYTV